MSVTAAQLQDLPKCELHVHLEGCISLSQVQAQAERAGKAAPRPFSELFAVSSLEDFLMTLDWICGLYQDGEAVQGLAAQFASYARQQNLQYVELIVNPSHWQLGLDALFGNLDEAFSLEFSRSGIDIRLLPSLGRHQSEAEADQLADWMTGCGLPRICGLSIDGSESASGSNNRRFAAAFERVRSEGFGTTAHAGESSGVAGVEEALDILGVERIDHGVRASESPALMERLSEQQITLNVCVSSNCALLYDKLSDHPLPTLLAAGVPCTINTDDPVILDITLNEELSHLGENFGWSLEDMLRFQENTICAAFCEPKTKTRLRGQLTQFERNTTGDYS